MAFESAGAGTPLLSQVSWEFDMPFRSSLLVMAQMVRDRRISPVELVDAHLRQIDAQNPRLNAFVCVLAEQAREAARRSETAVMKGETAHGEPLGLLHGVPVTVKDSFDMVGLPTYCGSKFRADHIAARDSTSAARLLAAGAIILGKTNAPEFLNMYETDNFITGRTNNPWDVSKTAGGSSGGEAAAIASFCSAGGIGSDGGGSIRVPAHFCGIAGLKPTPGRVPATGHYPMISHPGGLLGVGGPMARSAQDLRLLFAALAGHDPEDPFSAPVPLRPPQRDGVKIGVWEQFYRTPVGPEIAVSLRDAAVCARETGFGAHEFKPLGLERAHELWWLFFSRIYAPLTRTMISGREAESHWSGTELMYRALAEPAVSTVELLGALSARDRMRAALLRQMEAAGIAAILMPVCGTAAFSHRQRHFPVDGGAIELLEAMTPVTPWNLLGMPAVVIPFGLTSGGLPIGVQIVGRPWDEETILDIAVRLEQTRGPLPAPPGA
jgi:Asp-tRNA(Asn)/Glu-tRNA(Gln) amidotransferase A subunit family amidase